MSSLLCPQKCLSKDQTNVPKEYFVLGFGLITTIAFLSGVSTGTLCLVVGFIFPAFKSIKAMETRNSNEVTQWLVYWVVYSFFSVIEIFADALVYWIPFYYRFKLGFLLWAMLVSCFSYFPDEQLTPTYVTHGLLNSHLSSSPKHVGQSTFMRTS